VLSLSKHERDLGDIAATKRKSPAAPGSTISERPTILAVGLRQAQPDGTSRAVQVRVVARHDRSRFDKLSVTSP